jgi:type IV secretory pathway VirB10-like protein
MCYSKNRGIKKSRRRSVPASVASLLVILFFFVSTVTSAQPQQDDSAKGTRDTPPTAPKPAPDTGQSVDQSRSPAPNDPRSTASVELPGNTEIHAVLDTPLSSRTSQIGDRFTATVIMPVHDSSGAAVVPPGSKLMGQIADARTAQADSHAAATAPRGRFNLLFTEIALPTGQKIPIASAVSMDDKHELNLPAQTPFTLRFERPVSIPRQPRT